mmetsp:Transcript_89289/g.163819  ORF Transcript_89289/g.163819 Transcript_89289/m.163819 type:complete len:116 (+) Transcript_89289:281-628(+)
MGDQRTGIAITPTQQADCILNDIPLLLHCRPVTSAQIAKIEIALCTMPPRTITRDLYMTPITFPRIHTTEQPISGPHHGKAVLHWASYLAGCRIQRCQEFMACDKARTILVHGAE